MRRALTRALTVVFGGMAIAGSLSGCAPESAGPPPQDATHATTPAGRSTSASEAAPLPSTEPTSIASPAPGNLAVTIANFGADNQGVFASGVVSVSTEASGVCTLTAVSPAETLTASVEARNTPSAAHCGVIRLAAGPGEWSLTLSYESESISGVSAPTNVSRP